jgi:hypothetical protein
MSIKQHQVDVYFLMLIWHLLTSQSFPNFPYHYTQVDSKFGQQAHFKAPQIASCEEGCISQY